MPRGTGLKLSVPVDLQADIVRIILSARSPSGLGETAIHKLAESWEMVGAEVVSAVTGQPEPAVFLVSRSTSHAIVVADWPTVEFPADSTAPFDPAQHFARLGAPPALCAAAASPALATIPTAAAVATAAEALAASAVEAPLAAPGGRPVRLDERAAEDAEASPEASLPAVASGDRVEVEYGGRWLPGVLQWVHGGVANVKCDVDVPGVITMAPLTSVRPARQVATGTNHQETSKTVTRRNMRARSVG